jgi:hypothetical protein
MRWYKPGTYFTACGKLWTKNTASAVPHGVVADQGFKGCGKTLDEGHGFSRAAPGCG